MQLAALQMDQGLSTQFVTDVSLYNANTLMKLVVIAGIQ